VAARRIPDEVRSHCAAVARGARWVRIDPGATSVTGGTAGLDAGEHYLEGEPEDVARYVLILDAINFGSGWFPTLRDGGTVPMTRRLTEDVRRRGRPWTAEELRAMAPEVIAGVLEEDAGHPLMGHYAQGLRQLGAFLGERGALDVVAEAGGSAARLAAALAEGMPYFDDRGFYKRAQITANDLVLAGVADFADVDDLTVFADNLLPHVLRLDGVLVLDDELAARIDAGQPLEAGGEMERELRACTVHACEQLAARLGVAPRLLDNWLWNRGLQSPYADRPAHLTRTVFY
jgi:hypothetical protein